MKNQTVYFYVAALGFIPVWILLYFGYMFVAMIAASVQLLALIKYLHNKIR